MSKNSFTRWQGPSFTHEFFSHVFQCPFPFPPTFYFLFSSFFLFHFSCGDCCKQKWSIVEVACICTGSVKVFVKLTLPSLLFFVVLPSPLFLAKFFSSFVSFCWGSFGNYWTFVVAFCHCKMLALLWWSSWWSLGSNKAFCFLVLSF